MAPSINIGIYRTRDMSLVKQLGTHPAIYPHIIDDGCPENSADWQPVDSESRFYLIPWFYSLTDEPKPMGVIAYYSINHVLYDAHICLLPEYQHQMTVEIGHKANQWMFEHTPCQKLIAFIPVTKPRVLALVNKIGLKQEGYCPNSFSSDGELIDQWIYGIGRDQYGYGQQRR